MPVAPTLAETLLAATYDQRQRIGTLPFFTAAAQHQLAPASYVTLLRSLATLHLALGDAMTHTGRPELRHIWAQHLHKQPQIEQDLGAFSHIAIPDLPTADLSAHVLAERLRLRAPREPYSLLGSAYALATWHLGSEAADQHLAQAFHLPDTHGVGYLQSFTVWQQHQWDVFINQVNAIPLDSDAHQQAVQAAYELLDGIENLFDSLHPLDNNPTSELVRVLNPVAGNHKIPNDMREVHAAMRAGERVWQYIPYFELRYGMRGRQFTWSDAGWLVEVAHEDQESYNQQVLWLSRLLSARGMPQWTLECQLMLLHDELVTTIPEKRASYATIMQAAVMLADQRRAHLSDADLLGIDQAFYAQLGPEWHTWFPNCGCLIASAVADEQMGISGSITKLVTWLSDPARFPSPWIAAVAQTVAHAQRLVR
jgi:heme oxygenase